MATAQTGPYGCEGAKGSIGGLTLTQHRKAGTVLKRKPMPSNPQSVGQMGNRHMFGFVGAQWTTLDADEKASYEAIAEANLISEFAAYTKKNSERWQQGKTPTKEWPAAETAVPGTTVALAVTNRNDAPDTAVATITPEETDWGVIFYRGSAGAPTGVKSEVIAVRLLTGTSEQTVSVDHDGEDADIIKVAVFTVDGVRGSLVAAS